MHKAEEGRIHQATIANILYSSMNYDDSTPLNVGENQVLIKIETIDEEAAMDQQQETLAEGEIYSRYVCLWYY